MIRTPPLAMIAIVALAACGDETLTLRPIIDTPAPDTDGYPYDGVESFVFTAALAGDNDDKRVVTIEAGEPLVLTDVPFFDDMVLHLSARRAGQEIAYGRTCVIAQPPAADRPELQPHLFMSRTVKWSDTAEPIAPTRTDGHGFATHNGGAIFLGGVGPLSEFAEWFDPLESGLFTPLAAPLPRTGGQLATFGNGDALLVGGDNLTDLEVVDARTHEISAFPDGPAVIDHRLVSLVDGSVLVAGGRDPSSGEVVGLAWRITQGAGAVPDEPHEIQPALVYPRALHTMTRLGNEVGADVLVAGGRDNTGAAVPQIELYRPLSDTFELIDEAKASLPRWGHQAVRLPGGFVLILGGWEPDPEGGGPLPATTIKVYDPNLGSMTEAGTLPTTAAIVGFSTTRLADGRVLLAGGEAANGALIKETFIAQLDAFNGSVNIVRTDDLDAARAYHSAVELCDGTILLVGGGAPGAERYNPPSAGRR